MLSKLKIIGAAIAAFIGLYLRLMWVTKERDEAEEDASVLKSTIKVEQEKDIIIKEEKIEEFSRRAELLKEIEEIKKDEEHTKSLSTFDDDGWGGQL